MKRTVLLGGIIVASRFYLGRDGLLPRQDLAWGIAGMFFDSEPATAAPSP